ncbi:hypothetical protein [Streptomyces flaveolus]|uniref:hypothetical protein n=1 Tax=Streptomyces flaveolus TaxID=67297 RepID=UPI0036FFD3F3
MVFLFAVGYELDLKVLVFMALTTTLLTQPLLLLTGRLAARERAAAPVHGTTVKPYAR